LGALHYPTTTLSELGPLPLLARSERVACRDARQQREVLAELGSVKSVTHRGVVRMYEAFSRATA
jgi:hypothetical protein